MNNLKIKERVIDVMAKKKTVAQKYLWAIS